jgi:uncharacterized membrane protein
MTQKQKIFAVYMVTFVALVIWLGAIFLAPYLKSRSIGWSGLLYAVFSPVCHQIPDRSFLFCGFPLAVCSRCTGIYAGFFLGMLLYPVVKGFSSVSAPKTSLFIFFTSPIVIDTVGNLFSLWTTTPWLRFVIGLSWGAVLPFYFVSGFSDAWIRIREKK